jgi:hypothetical protein
MIVRQRSMESDGSPYLRRKVRWRAPSNPLHDGRVIGRFLAICGWLASQARRPFRERGASGLARSAPVVLAVVLLVAAAVPIVLPMFDPQPNDVTVQEIIDDAVDEPTGWVRLRGEVVPLDESPSERPGDYGLLVDEADTLQAIVLRTDRQLEHARETFVTGHVVEEVAIVEDIPFEATVFGAPPTVVVHRIVELDAAPKPVRVTLWPLAIPPLIGAVLLLIGARVGYPLFRPSSEVDVLSVPLGPGERLLAAWGGRLEQHVRDLADPGGALLVVRPGPKGNLLTAQPLPDDGGPAPPPVAIGGGWTSGRIGHVYAKSETVPALLVRAELVDAIFLFTRTGERDRVAAHVAVERG